MILFKNGIEIEEDVYLILLDQVEDVERYLASTLNSLIEQSKREIIERWMPEIQNDESITAIPKKKEDLIRLILTRSSYRNKAEREMKTREIFTIT